MTWKQKKRCLDLLAGEEGWTRKVWGEYLTVCLAYPNLYRTGMSNLGFQAVYALINRHPGCLCERVFLPEPGEEPRAGGRRAPDQHRIATAADGVRHRRLLALL